jgi:protein TonB
MGIVAILLVVAFIVLNRSSDGRTLDVSVNSSSGDSGTGNMGGNLSGGAAPAGSVTRSWVSGQWGPGCPMQEAGSVYLEPNGTVRGSGMSGTWTLSGNTVTTLTGGRSESSNWVYVSQDEARVTVPGIGTSILRRCGAGRVPATGAAAPQTDASLTPARLVGGSITGADYPASAIRAGAQGITTVSIQIGVDGRVTGCSVTASSGNSALDSTTCSLVQRRYRYAPATRNGQPVASSSTQSISWSPPAL